MDIQSYCIAFFFRDVLSLSIVSATGKCCWWWEFSFYNDEYSSRWSTFYPSSFWYFPDSGNNRHCGCYLQGWCHPFYFTVKAVTSKMFFLVVSLQCTSFALERKETSHECTCTSYVAIHVVIIVMSFKVCIV